ncbi:MAG: helix-turn-helix transcriptional regulator [Collinsella sp.]|nr:helix-turn-helix transcriptional regulator [Collinsella sp.]
MDDVDDLLKREIGKNLQRARKEHGYSNVSDFADALGMRAGTIVRWEQGKSTPPVDVAWRIAKHLGLTIDELVGRNTASERGAVEAALLESFRKCTADRQERILETAKDAALMSMAVGLRRKAEQPFGHTVSPSSMADDADAAAS